MSRSVYFAYPGDLSLKTGGYGYDRRVIKGLRQLGWQVNLLALGEGFPFPTQHSLSEAARALSALPDDSVVIIDGLAFGVLAAWAEEHSSRLKIVALVHHPLASETGLSINEQEHFYRSERRALAVAQHILVTSAMTARELAAHYSVDLARVTVALPGTDKFPPSTNVNDVPHILSVGTLSRRKGHDVLLDALKSIEDLSWQASIIGSKSLDPSTSAALSQQVQMLELQERVALVGEVDDTQAAFASSDIFALASRYEGYGMVFAEALSHGLPIVACRAGAVPEVVPEDAAILVEVDDVTAFGHALRLLLTNPAEKGSRASAAKRAGVLLPSWEDTSNTIARTLVGLHERLR